MIPNQTSNDMGAFVFRNIVPSSSLSIIIITSLLSAAAIETIRHTRDRGQGGDDKEEVKVEDRHGQQQVKRNSTSTNTKK